MDAIHFRVDRVDQSGGLAFLTDFKLGKPPTVHKTETSRRSKVVSMVRHGTLLQGPIYALSAPDKIGRYIYLSGDGDYPQREFRFSSVDEEVCVAVESILNEVGEARAGGHMFPRVSESKQDRIPSACEHCTVKEACPVVDSSVRFSVMRRAQAHDESDQTWSALWWRGEAVANE